MKRHILNFLYFRVLRSLVVWSVLAWIVLRGGWAHAVEGRVTGSEVVMRSAPYAIAPELVRLHSGDRLFFTDDAPGASGWWHVQLPDGRRGFVSATEAVAFDTKPSNRSDGSDSSNPIATANLMAAQDSPDARSGQNLAATTVSDHPPELNEPQTYVGVMIELLPAGTLRDTVAAAGMQSSNVPRDTLAAYALAPFVDLSVTPHLAVGASPQLVFHVKGEGEAGSSATELDLRFRLTGRAPVSPKVRVFARVSPAYSIIFLPATPPGAHSLENPAGVQFDLAVGTEIALAAKLLLVIDTGYQLGFQSSSLADRTASFDGTGYLHLGAGLAVGL